MLSLDLVRQLKVAGQHVALPLTRDLLLIAGSEDAEGLTMMTQIAEKERDAPRPLCGIPHVLTGDEWTPWSVAADHAAAEAFQMLRLNHFGGEYAEQKQLLEALVARQGPDVFVASFSARRFEEHRPPASFCVWTKGIPSWLPQTDVICFHEPETNVTTPVHWQRVATEHGQLLKPLDYWPPRWAVEEFPSSEWLTGCGL
jgi:hypothetical protein